MKRFVLMGTDHGTCLNARVPDLCQGAWGNGNASFLSAKNQLGYRSGMIPAVVGRAGSAYDIAALRNNNGLRAAMNIYNGFTVAREHAEGSNSSIPNGHLQSNANGSFSATGTFRKTGSSISIDQLLAEQLYQSDWSSRHRSLLMGRSFKFSVDRNGTLMSYQRSPLDVYRLFFGNGQSLPDSNMADQSNNSSQPSQPDALALTRASIIDRVKADIDSVRANRRLSAEDRRRLESYLQQVSELTFANPAVTNPAVSAMCEPTNVSFPNNGIEVVREYFKLARLAFLCDMTRVVSIGGFQTYDTVIDDLRTTMINDAKNNNPKAYVDDRNTDHAAWHNSTHAPTSVPVHQQYIELVAEFAEMMQNTPDPYGTGSMLDNTLIVGAHELGATEWTREANPHIFYENSYVSFGGSNFLKTGMMIDTSDANRQPVGGSCWTVNSLLTTWLRAMGMTQSSWGGQGFGEFSGSQTQRRSIAGNQAINFRNASGIERNHAIPGILANSINEEG